VKKDVLFLIAQFFLFAFYFFEIENKSHLLPNWAGYGLATLIAIGFLIIILGIVNLNDNLTAFPAPKKNSELISNGIYKYIRHPIYTGIVIAMLAFAGYTISYFKILVTLVLAVVFYFKSKLEETYLMDRHKEYILYKEKTGRFLPKIRYSKKE